MVKALPNTSFLPVPKSAPAGHTTAAAHLLWQVFPRYPCLEYKDNSGQSCPVRYTWTASFGPGLMFWQKWFNLTPQFVAYQLPGHLLHPPLVFYCIFLYLSGFVRCSKACRFCDTLRPAPASHAGRGLFVSLGVVYRLSPWGRRRGAALRQPAPGPARPCGCPAAAPCCSGNSAGSRSRR